MLALIEETAPQVASTVRKITRNVHKHSFGEQVSEEELLGSVKTAIFEVLYENPDLRGMDLVIASAKKHKHYLWSPGTTAYDRIRRETSSQARAKVFADFNKLPWGTDAQTIMWNQNPEYGNSKHHPTPVNITFIDEESIFGEEDAKNVTSISIFNVLKRYAGPELATIFVMHYGFKLPLLFLVRELLDMDEKSKEFLKVYRRVVRMMEKMETVLSQEIGEIISK